MCVTRKQDYEQKNREKHPVDIWRIYIRSAFSCLYISASKLTCGSGELCAIRAVCPTYWNTSFGTREVRWYTTRNCSAQAMFHCHVCLSCIFPSYCFFYCPPVWLTYCAGWCMHRQLRVRCPGRRRFHVNLRAGYSVRRSADRYFQ